MGTVTALYLIGTRLELQPLYRKVLLLAGLLTLSLAFYVLIIAYLVIRLVRDRDVWWSMGVVVVLAALVLVNLDKVSDLPLISRVVVGAEYGAWDNRTSSGFDQEFKGFLSDDTYTIMFGYGNAAHTKLGVVSSSIKSIVYNHGVIGSILLLFLLATVYVNVYSCSPLRVWVRGAPFVIIFLMFSYQRPGILTPLYMSIFCFGLGLEVSRGLQQKMSEVAPENRTAL